MAAHFHRHRLPPTDSPDKLTSKGRLIMRLHLALISSALIFFPVAAAQASDVSTLKNKLKPWQPTEISLKNDQLTVVIPAASIDDETYKVITSSGICSPIWTKDAPADYLKKIKAINITNKFKASGYSFENPLSTCNEMGKLMDKPATALLLGNTHVFKGSE